MILQAALDLVRAGKMVVESDQYPIRRVERYQCVAELQGIGASSEMPTMWGVVIRIEFVPINGQTGADANPREDVYFKILPKGSSNIPRILLRFPLLDCEPHGDEH